MLASAPVRPVPFFLARAVPIRRPVEPAGWPCPAPGSGAAHPPVRVTPGRAAVGPALARAEAEKADDAAVVARVLGGDADAYAVLVARYHGRCLRYAERVLGDRDDAEDAVQRAFVRAYDALGRYEERARFAPWLFAVVATECRAAAATRARRAWRFVADDRALLQVPTPDAARDATFDAGLDAGARLERALGRLEPRLREAFLLRHVEGLSYEEMRAATGAGASALKMRVKRACDALRALLEEP